MAPSNACKWLERDAEGRPRCEHGWACKANKTGWRCRLKHSIDQRKYTQTEKGRATQRRRNASEAKKSSKALYELTRIRVS